MPVGGGDSVIFLDGETSFGALAADAASLYWGDSDVKKVSLDGGRPTLLALSPYAPEALALDDANVYWTTGFTDGIEIGSLMTVPKGGGPAKTLATGLNRPAGVAVDADYVFWANSDDGTIMRLPKSGGLLSWWRPAKTTPSG